MAATEFRRYMTVQGKLKIDFIYIDSVDATSLANVVTQLQNPFACAVFEISHCDQDGGTNDSQTKATTPLAVFSAASGVTQKLIDVSALTAGKFYELVVYGF